MLIYKTIDFDKTAAIAYSRTINAINNWISGRILEEQALLNHIIGQFKPTKHSCDIGAKSIVLAKTKIFTLHRKGKKQIDKFGSDLAITLKINSISFCKTAFFQFKKSKALETTFQKDQLLECEKIRDVYDRSFVFVADEERQCVRLKTIAEIDKLFDRTKETLKLNCEEWFTEIQWLDNWLQCKIGKISDLKTNDNIENLLQGLSIEDEKQPDEFSKAIDDLLSNFPDLLPARQWIIIDLQDLELEVKRKALTK